MAVVLSALRTELLTDPIQMGYSAFIATGNDNGLVDLLNSVAANASHGATSTVSVAQISVALLQNEVVASEYLVLSQAQRDLWNILLNATTGVVYVSNTNIRSQFLAIWSAGTTTRANLAALQTRQAARSEILFGENVLVNAIQVYQARVSAF